MQINFKSKYMLNYYIIKMYFKQQTALCYSTMKKIVTQAIYSTITFLLANIKWHFSNFFP